MKPLAHSISKAEPFGSIRVLALAAGMVIASPAAAQSGAPQDSVGQDALDAVSQPLTDLGLRSREIPDILLAAERMPYNVEGLDACDDLWDQITLLEETLGPDADATEEDGESLINSGLQASGDILGGFIPFRGLVRRISGAEARENRWEEAIYAGVARRSFLKGLALGRDCPTPEEAAIEAAYDVLGLGGQDSDGTGEN